MVERDNPEKRRQETWRNGILARAEAALAGYSPQYKAQMLAHYRRSFDPGPEYFPYGHYLYIATPVRVLAVRSTGLKVGAQIFDPATQSLKFANSYLSKIEWDRDCETEEITEADFLLLCLAAAARMREQRIRKATKA